MSKKCPCGGVILADTEDWPTPVCYNCYADKIKNNEHIESEHCWCNPSLAFKEDGKPDVWVHNDKQ